MLNINGQIMSEDIPVVNIIDGVASIINKDLAPLYFRKSKDVTKWLESRAIDAHRTNSRLLKKALRLKDRDDASTSLSVNAVTITDTYWFKENGSTLTWDDVRFKENMFDNLALKGDPNSFDQKPSRTPELTNIGSFEKCWRLIDGKWWMYKSGNENELFSELFVYELGKRLGFNMAYYEYSDGYVRSLDFTDNASVNFEPIDSLVGDNEDYSYNFNVLNDISKDVAKDYLKMIYLDTVCKNMDRHTKNYGLLRDKKTGKIISLSPNYDNNIALISRGYTADVLRDNDGLIRFFNEFLNENSVAKNMFLELDIPNITEEMINECIMDVPIKVDACYIKMFVLNGAKIIDNLTYDGQNESFTMTM